MTATSLSTSDKKIPRSIQIQSQIKFFLILTFLIFAWSLQKFIYAKCSSPMYTSYIHAAIYIILIYLFLTSVPFLYPLKMSENLWFSNILRGCTNGILEWNGLMFSKFAEQNTTGRSSQRNCSVKKGFLKNSQGSSCVGDSF